MHDTDVESGPTRVFRESGAQSPRGPVHPTAELVPSSGQDERAASSTAAELSRSYDQNLFPKVLTFLLNQRREATMRRYNRDLFEFADFIRRNRELGLKRFLEVTGPRDLTRDHVVLYKASLEHRGLAPNTINLRLAVLSSYFKFLASEVDGEGSALLDRNVMAGVKRPQQRRVREHAALESDQVTKLLTSIPRRTPSGLFHRALLCTLFGTGLRNSEIRSMRVGHVHTESGYHVANLETKGGREHKKVLAPWVWNEIRVYLDSLAAAGVALSSETYIFQPPPKRARGRVGAALSIHAFNRIVKKYCAALGLADSERYRYTVHMGRSTFATCLARDGVALDDLQCELGHARVSTTIGYVRRARLFTESPALSLSYGAPYDNDL